MANFFTSSAYLRKAKSTVRGLTGQLLLMIAALTNGAIWVLAIGLLKLSEPTYTSEGAMILPGVGSQGSVTIPGLGTASTSGNDNQSPYNYLLKIDPRQNYKYIGMSDAVLSQAAKKMDMSSDEFGEPKIILGEGTTIIEFSIDGRTPEEARQKADTFYNSLIDHIDHLRSTQLNYQKDTTEKTLEISTDKVQEAQSKLSQFRSTSQLKIDGQIQSLGDRLEEFRLAKADLAARERAINSRIQQLELNLNLSTAQASDSLLILDDKLIQESLQSYGSKVKEVQLLYSFYTAESPQIKEGEQQLAIMRRSITARGTELLNKPVSLAVIQKLNLSSEKGRKNLVGLLLTLPAERAALQEQIRETNRQINDLETRLTALAEEQPILNRLKQDVRLSESILVSDAARLNLNKPELATSYPFLQLLSEPSLPEEADSNARKTIVLGALAASFLLTTGMIIFWWEKPDFTNNQQSSENNPN